CEVRCMAKVRNGAKVKRNASVQEMINPDGKGRCAMILDPVGRRDDEPPYQGIVALQGDCVADILENYMLNSEQLETRLKLAADKTRIAGILLQKMPESESSLSPEQDSDAWTRNCQLLSTVTAKELLKPNHLPKLLHNVFWQEDLIELSFNPVEFTCGCTREKTDNMLRSLGQQEVEDILKAEGKVEVRCHFCNKVQTYTKEQAEALFKGPPVILPTDTEAPPRPQ
ncbi:MAG: Hsp33 family molecular chaperone HslO, partial [Burkholderiales bacterium]|nr:Hsp33 family molecular chaperone HslO [Burkholderiales bacterium]